MFFLEFWLMNSKVGEPHYAVQKEEKKVKHEESIYRIVPLFFDAHFRRRIFSQTFFVPHLGDT